MVQASRKVITPEVEETTLPAPRFDEEAEQMARPVVPLSKNVVRINIDEATSRPSQPRDVPSRQGLWVMAALAGLVLAVGAMAFGITAYKRNQAAPAQALIPAADATRLELNQNFRPGPSLRSSAPADSDGPKTTSSNAPATVNEPKMVSSQRASSEDTPAPKPIKRKQIVISDSSGNDSDANDSSGKPKPRLVDRYVMRKP